MLTLYSTTTCQPCRIVARKFEAAGVKFEKVDLDLPEHEQRLNDLKKALGTTTIHTPTVVHEGVVVMVNLEPATLNDLIAKHKRDEA